MTLVEQLEREAWERYVDWQIRSLTALDRMVREDYEPVRVKMGATITVKLPKRFTV